MPTRGQRPHIGFFGRRNAGKSSLLNALAGQSLAIVSPEPGTTTDPVEKAMELFPVGPVVLVDTAGLDDEGPLGQQRVARSLRALEHCDLAVLVGSAESWGPLEEDLGARLSRDGREVIPVLTRADLGPGTGAAPTDTLRVSAHTGQGLEALREALRQAVSRLGEGERPLVADLVPPGGLAVLVVPIDSEAPKGRLILPQAQVLRELLDHGAVGMVTREKELSTALGRLQGPPDLVITDSQAFERVSAETPPGVPLTSFSILFARQKGDLTRYVEGARAIDGLRPGDRVLIAESCTHHPTGDDIGTVKLPRWLQRKAGGDLRLEFTRGVDFPADLTPYRLVVHCGACMTNRRQVLHRQGRAWDQGVPMTNYGVAIAWCLGVAERALRGVGTMLKDVD